MSVSKIWELQSIIQVQQIIIKMLLLLLKIPRVCNFWVKATMLGNVSTCWMGGHLEGSLQCCHSGQYLDFSRMTQGHFRVQGPRWWQHLEILCWDRGSGSWKRAVLETIYRSEARPSSFVLFSYDYLQVLMLVWPLLRFILSLVLE